MKKTFTAINGEERPGHDARRPTIAATVSLSLMSFRARCILVLYVPSSRAIVRMLLPSCLRA